MPTSPDYNQWQLDLIFRTVVGIKIVNGEKSVALT